MARLAPSILSCDFSRLREELLLAQEGGAEIIHIDVMDGHFVPNLTFGSLLVEAVRKILPQATLDVHLMISNPRQYVGDFVQAGADMLSFHAEAVEDFDAVVWEIKKRNSHAGIALCPGTPLSVLDHVLERLSFVLLLTVNPGFGGQKFIPGMEEKIAALRRKIWERGLSTEIEIDGGVNEKNITFLASRGASIIVAGSLIFSNKDEIRERVQRLSEMIRPF
ncbi:MAG: ribulose-phosphate 3-epimerase [Candidatus Caldatribacteriaceae bacterium]